MTGRSLAVSWRRLRAAPAFALFSVATLAVGIAAATCAYAVVRAGFAPPGGVPDIDGIVTISHSPYGNPRMVGLSRPDFEDLRRRQTTMHDVVAFTALQQMLTVDGTSRVGAGEIVTGNYFQTLRIEASLGRVLQPRDDAPGAPAVVVISHRLWTREFGGRPDAIGRTMQIGGHSFEVVGVAPEAFAGLLYNGRIQALTWLPLSTVPLFPQLMREVENGGRDVRWLFVRGRAREGIGIDAIAADVGGIARLLDREHPLGLDLSPAARGVPFNSSRAWMVRYTSDLRINEGIEPIAGPIAGLLLAAVALVLLVVCSNLGNLMAARGAVRRHEFAMRLALGATKARLIVDILREVALVAAAGGAFGLVLSWYMLRIIRGPIDMLPGVTVMLEPRLDLPAFLTALGAAAVALIVAGVIPGWILTRGNLHADLVSGVSPTIITRWRVRRLLIAAQVAVSIVLLATAALFLMQAAMLSRFDGGLDLDRFGVVEVDFGMQNYDVPRTARVVDAVLERLHGHPGIRSAAVASGLPFGVSAPRAELRTNGAPVLYVRTIAATPEVFETTGLDLIDGRAFDARDRPDAMPVLVVDTQVATSLFGRSNVVGEQVMVAIQSPVDGDELPVARTIIGLVETAQSPGGGNAAPAAWVPLSQQPATRLVFLARTRNDPAHTAREIHASLMEAEPSLGILQAGGARAVIGPPSRAGLVVASVSTILGICGTVVVLVGLYGVITHAVERRTREMGLRLALGATPRGVMLMVIREGLAPVGVGIAAGGAAVIGVRYGVLPMLTPLLPAASVLALATVPILLVLAATAACYLPARRASLVDPAAALKQQ